MPQTPISSLWTAVESTKSLPLLQPNELQLWHIDLMEQGDSTSLFDSCMSLLTEPERARVHRRQHPQGRQQSAIGRGCLRILLGSALHTDPRLVPIVAGANNKPELASQDIAFNVAHSGNTILIALARNTSIGVDVEHIDPHMDFMPVAHASFTPTELAKLAAITNPTAQRRAFYRSWTQKEAITKADGRGLTLPLPSFEVPIDLPSDFPVPIPQSNTIFYLSDLPLDSDIADGVTAAVAIDTPNISTKLLRFPPAISPG